MRRFSFALLLLVISQSGAQQPAETKQASDQDHLQGVWIVTSLETGGKAESGPYRGSFLFSKDRKAILREGTPGTYQPIDYAFTLDSSKTPKSIDLTIKNKTIRGIYKIENDALTLCVSMGGDRPTEFATKAGSDCERFIMRRKYSDKKMTFAVDIPGKPEEKPRKITTTSGDTTCSFVLSRNDTERLAYLVSVVPIGAKHGGKELEEAIGALKKAMLAEMAVTPNPMDDPGEEFKFGSITGSEWGPIGTDTKGTKEKGVARFRIFAAGENLYGLMVIGPRDDVTRPRNVGSIVYRFWESFELIPAKP